MEFSRECERHRVPGSLRIDVSGGMAVVYRPDCSLALLMEISDFWGKR